METKPTAQDQAAAEALERSVFVKLALELPHVGPEEIAALYKVAFNDGTLHGLEQARQAFERVLLEAMPTQTTVAQ